MICANSATPVSSLARTGSHSATMMSLHKEADAVIAAVSERNLLMMSALFNRSSSARMRAFSHLKSAEYSAVQILPSAAYGSSTVPANGVGAMVEDKIMANNQKLDMISQLEPNWNGYGAEPIPSSAIDSMRDILGALTYQPEIFPTASPGIQFEYDNKNGDYLEFELFDGIIECYLKKKDGNEKEFCVSTVDEINKVVNEFYG